MSLTLRRDSAIVLSFGVFLFAAVFIQTSSGIAIRPFKHKTTVNGVNCSTETAFAAFGCYCLLNGQRCLGNLRCINHNCSCPTGGSFISGTNGLCIPNWWIAINCSSLTTSFGFPTCSPGANTNVPGLIIGGSTNNKPISCQLQVIKSITPPVDVPYYDDAVNNYLAVDPTTGQVFFTALVPPFGAFPAPGVVPCGPQAADPTGNNPSGLSEPLIQTYQVQCTDSRGIVSGNVVTFNLTFPPCDVTSTCNADGSCCVTAAGR